MQTWVGQAEKKTQSLALWVARNNHVFNQSGMDIATNSNFSQIKDQYLHVESGQNYDSK